MADEIIVETKSVEVVEVGVPGPQGPAGAAGTGLETLTTKGDTLFRGQTTGERLPIGSVGQVMKVSSGGVPHWANESGAVTSVNGATGAVTVAAATHAVEHEPGEGDTIQATAALVTTNVAALNGIYFSDDTSTNGKLNFFRTGTRKNTKLQYNNSTVRWELIRNTVVEAEGDEDNNATPWSQNWQDPRTPAQVTSITVARVALETMVQKLAETGGAATATTSEDGLMSSSDKTKLNGIAAGAEVNVQANWTEADNGSDAFILNKPATFAPTTHAASHASAGSDPLAPSAINAQSIYSVSSVTGAGTLAASRAIEYLTSNYGSSPYTITLPLTAAGSLNGDTFVFRSVNAIGADVTIQYIETGTPVALATISAVGQQFRFRFNGSANEWSLISVDSHPANRITSGTLAHERGGLEADVSAYNGLVKISGGATSAVTVSATGESVIGATDAAAARSAISAAAASHTHGTGDITGLGGAATLNVGTTTGTVAAGDDSRFHTRSHAMTGTSDHTASNWSVFYSNGSGQVTELALGAANTVLTSNGASSAPSFAAAASGGTKTYAVFTAEHNQPPATAFATLDTRNSIAVLDFDAATDENAVFVGIMPEAASLGSGLIVRLHWMATSATSGNVRWGVQFERSNTDLDADSFAAAVEANGAANGTSGILTTTAITVTDFDGITAGDVFRLKVFRNADDATNDTMTGDAELVAVEIRSAA